ncbi:RNA polymerase sigma factor [Mariniphaga sediminis]|uniref:RNA polymerase sigma factor n=1 Tax=Mariniphaga sediminis TaxID=1628158 RepID=UPI0015593A79|nr:RNA polymerase sigma-70 factor [Mariniphaga sediminis]
MGTIHLNKEEDLLLRLKKGDKVAFELIFYKYKGKLFDFIRKSLPTSEEAENIIQDVFTNLWLYRKKLDSGKSLNALLYTMVRNELFMHLRKQIVRRKYVEEFGLFVNENDDSTQNQIEYNELKLLLAQLIESMPEKRKEVFKLSRYEGLSYKEIAKKLGISEHTVDTQIRKALSYLKENLKKTTFVLFSLFFKRF